MKTTFKLVDNEFSGAQMVEVYYEGKLRATISPDDSDKATASIRVVTTHLAQVEPHIGGIMDIYVFHFFTD